MCPIPMTMYVTSLSLTHLHDETSTKFTDLFLTLVWTPLAFTSPDYYLHPILLALIWNEAIG